MLMKSVEMEEGLWTFDAVQQRIVDAVRAWWHGEGGRWPFASDGPWHLLTREARADIKAEGLKRSELDQLLAAAGAGAPEPKVPLSLAEIAERDEVTEEWLPMVSERDRRIVVLGAMQLAGGRSRISWRDIRAKLEGGPAVSLVDLPETTRGLGMRYSRAITAICKQLNGGQ